MLDQTEALKRIAHNVAFRKFSKHHKKEILPVILILLHDLEKKNHPHFDAIYNSEEELAILINRVKLRSTFFKRESKQRIHLEEGQDLESFPEKPPTLIKGKTSKFYDVLKQKLIEKGIDKLIE